KYTSFFIYYKIVNVYNLYFTSIQYLNIKKAIYTKCINGLKQLFIVADVVQCIFNMSFCIYITEFFLKVSFWVDDKCRTNDTVKFFTKHFFQFPNIIFLTYFVIFVC